MEDTWIVSPRPMPASVTSELAALGLRGTRLQSIDDLWPRLDSNAGLIVVVTEDEDAVSDVQRLRKLNPGVEILLLCEDAVLGNVKSSLFSAPGIGKHTRCSRLERDPTQAVVSSARRVAARRASAQNLNVANAQLRGTRLEHRVVQALGDVLDQAPIGVVTIDRDGQVVTWNGAAEVISGRTTRQALAQFANELVPMHREGAVGAASQEVEMRDSNGRQRRIWFKTVALSTAVVSEVRVLYFDDVTERRNLERQMQEAQKLDSLGMLAGGVAHDFNNYLTGILGNVELAQLEVDASSPAVDHLELAGQGIAQCADLCRQLLSYAGKGNVALKPTDVGALVTRLVKLFEVSLPHGVKLQLAVPPAPAVVEADATQLRQLVLNLISNATHAVADSRGSVHVDVDVVDWAREGLDRALLGSDLEEGRYVTLTVSDTGKGMPPEVLQRIFEPFFTTKESGRGLGLAAVLGIVRGHGGALLVDSGVDRGTRFDVLLPTSGGTEHELRGGAQTGGAPGARTVLVVDDEEAVRRVTLSMLRKQGMRCLEASEGVHGLEVFAQYRDEIDVVVLDVIMPEMDGPTLLRRLRALEPNLPAVFISGFADGLISSTDDEAGPQGAVEFVSKPFGSTQLISAIRLVTAGHVPRGQSVH